jgi:hypothetical protein
MDKSWMQETHRFGEKYSKGVEQFIRMARGHVDELNRIKCPCCKCENRYYKPIDMVEDDLFINEIDMNYTQWVFNGEEDPFRINEHVNHNDDNASSEDIDEVEQMLNDIGMGTFPGANAGESSTTPGPTTNDYEPRTFDQVLEDPRGELYPDCIFKALFHCESTSYKDTLQYE